MPAGVLYICNDLMLFLQFVPNRISQVVNTSMRVIWSEAKSAYRGQFVSFAGVQAYPHPLQQPPIVVGGKLRSALCRAVEKANGWFGWALDLEETSRALADLREVANALAPRDARRTRGQCSSACTHRRNNRSAIRRAWCSPACSHLAKGRRCSGAGAVHWHCGRYAWWAGIN